MWPLHTLVIALISKYPGPSLIAFVFLIAGTYLGKTYFCGEMEDSFINQVNSLGKLIGKLASEYEGGR